jgi:hypothetical protein
MATPPLSDTPFDPWIATVTQGYTANIEGERYVIHTHPSLSDKIIFDTVGIGILIKIIIMMALLVNGAGFSGANVLL